MILSTRAGSVRQNVHSGVPWTAMLAGYQGAHIGGYAHPPGTVFLRSLWRAFVIAGERISRMHEEAAQGAPWTQG
jgi:hypothetical protein